MKKRNRITLILPVILFASLIARAEKPATTLNFLKSDSVDVANLLPEPPAQDSLEQQSEIGLILKLQEDRTPEQVARIKLEDKFTVFIFSDVLGPGFTPENCPETKALFEKTMVDAKYFSKAGKAHWDRARPPMAHPKVKAVIDETDSSYPSGHATRSMVMALMLAEIDPANRAKLIQRGELVGWDRVIAGVHYPSDVVAGRELGLAIFHELMKNPQFKSDLEKARTEIDHARTGATAAAK
ncbi:MAG TPA: phosphatase PAP2 family protein [Tepidisphaeraceae bacterium]|jgi:acid phosphatase (class A)|nr:phosphatase PAP2 family protein [Tepidisphaeraceae bacterium]